MRLLVIGGMDPTGGAGVLRDVWTARSLAPEAAIDVVVTALTRQGSGRPARAFPIDRDRLEAALQRVDTPSAIKIGMVPDPAASVLEHVLEGTDVPVVLDPVIEATAGGRLGGSIDRLVSLSSRATVVTPNLGEALALAGATESDDTLLERVAACLHASAVLLKTAPGAPPGRARDALWLGGKTIVLERERSLGDPRGTGCALATAIAVELGRGHGVHHAVSRATAWLDHARRNARADPEGLLHLPTP